MMKGIGVSYGIGIGRALVYGKPLPEVPTHAAADVEQELAAFEAAVEAVILRTQELSRRMDAQFGKNTAEIFEAHLTLLRDEKGLLAPIRKRVGGDGVNAALAVWQEMTGVANALQESGDSYLCERAADIEDLRNSILMHLMGVDRREISRLPDETVLIADDLAPSDTARLDVAHTAAIVTANGGPTGHTAIMTRSMEIPAVVGCGSALSQVRDGDVIAVDGQTGELAVNPDAQTLERFRARQAALLVEKDTLTQYRGLPTATADGVTLELFANIGSPRDVTPAKGYGAEGIGLVRSEFLYMERNSLPDEEEQYLAYRSILEGMEGRPVIFRTMDAGGDKGLPGLGAETEENPFLGYRAIRICLREPKLFKTQLCALLRASLYGPLRIMFPMISSVEQFEQAKFLLEEAKRELDKRGERYAAELPVGIMIEIPAAAVLAGDLAGLVDFFSIGTNDLIQYTLAVDRGNANVSDLYSPFHPAVLRLISGVIRAAREHGIPCGMCGEAAGNPELAALFLGMGLREFSVTAPLIPALRKQIRTLNSENCAALAREVSRLSREDQVRERLCQ